jgi:hypothetical protein
VKWIPRSGKLEAGGCIWLPRMIDKARRFIVLGSGYLLDGEYMFGEHDFADGRLLRFLGLSSAQIVEIVRNEPDDARAAERIIAASGRTPEECRAFSRRFRLVVGPFLSMIDADEGRAPAGAWTTFLRALYNTIVVPPALAAFRRASRR